MNRNKNPFAISYLSLLARHKPQFAFSFAFRIKLLSDERILNLGKYSMSTQSLVFSLIFVTL